VPAIHFRLLEHFGGDEEVVDLGLLEEGKCDLKRLLSLDSPVSGERVRAAAAAFTDAALTSSAEPPSFPP
jgi:hypothetical protein